MFYHSTFNGSDTVFAKNLTEPERGHKTRRHPEGLPITKAKVEPQAPHLGWEYFGSTTSGTVWVHWWTTPEPVTVKSFDEEMAERPPSKPMTAEQWERELSEMFRMDCETIGIHGARQADAFSRRCLGLD